MHIRRTKLNISVNFLTFGFEVKTFGSDRFGGNRARNAFDRGI